MFYYLYEIKCLVNGKIYVGVHKTANLDDGYMGSGTVIKQAIEKHGINNFTKVILEYFDDSASMYAREKEVVTDEFLLRTDTYNLRRGGSGGFDHINKSGLNFKGYNSVQDKNSSISKMRDVKFRKSIHHLLLAGARKSWSAGRRSNFNKEVNIKLRARALTEDAKEKRKATFTNIRHQQGDKNSQYGTMWITDGETNKKIRKTDQIPQGWVKGRVL